MKIILVSEDKTESTLHAIRRNPANKGPAKKRIADYITRHITSLVGISITELAHACGCGEATVVRFARRIVLFGLGNSAAVAVGITPFRQQPGRGGCFGTGENRGR